MGTHRERLTAPLSWWLTAVGFGVVCGWIVLVATTWPIAITSAVLGTVVAAGVVWGFGSVIVEGGADGMRVGSAHLPATHVGRVVVLDTRGFRERLGPHADARAWMRTRPYIDTGVMVEVADTSDPTPYWLISCRHPQALAAALGQTGEASTSAPTTNGDVHGGEEED